MPHRPNMANDGGFQVAACVEILFAIAGRDSAAHMFRTAVFKDRAALADNQFCDCVLGFPMIIPRPQLSLESAASYSDTKGPPLFNKIRRGFPHGLIQSVRKASRNAYPDNRGKSQKFAYMDRLPIMIIAGDLPPFKSGRAPINGYQISTSTTSTL